MLRFLSMSPLPRVCVVRMLLYLLDLSSTAHNDSGCV
jgi:hypothetical protein